MRPIFNTGQSEEITTDSTMYFDGKINSISEPALKIEQDVFSFDYVTVHAMAFSHLRFLEFSLPEIKRAFKD